MAEDKAPDAAAEPKTQPGTLPLTMAAQYVRDLSFENPNAPDSIANFGKTQPQVQLNIDVRVQPGKDSDFEVTLSLNLEAKHGDATDFIIELQYCGLCKLGEVPENLVQPVLFIEIPRLLFPFARAIIANAIREAGFPPIMIHPIDFAALFKARVDQAAAKKAAAGNAGGTADNEQTAGDEETDEDEDDDVE